MTAIFIVCPHCSKNIMLASDVFDASACPLCAGPLTMELLRIKNSFINVEEANLAFETGKQYFDNINFREALIYFQKSLEFNANHYMSFYYAGLCDIYENEKNEGYDRILNLLRVLKYSILKLESAQVDMQYKIPFILAAVHEIYILLLSEYNKMDVLFDKQNAPRALRHRLLLLAKHINSFIALDKELLLVSNPEVAKIIVRLVDLGIGACIKSTQSRAAGDINLSIPLDEDFDAATKIYRNLLHYVQRLDPEYSIESYRSDFITLGLFNRDALAQIDKYNSARGSKDRAAYLSIKGDVLNYLKEHCKTALLYTYNTLYKNLYIQKNDPLRVDLLTHGILFCYELLNPRIHQNADKRVIFESVTYNELQQFTPYLDAFLYELYESNKKLAINELEKFYGELVKMTYMYFDLVTNRYTKPIKYIKHHKDKDICYYADFLINIILVCSLALKDMIELSSFKSKNRIALLKVGKRACEEFLLLHDYQIAELGKNPVYAVLINIYDEILNAL